MEVLDCDSVASLGFSDEVLDGDSVTTSSGSFCDEQPDAETIVQKAMTNLTKIISQLRLL